MGNRQREQTVGILFAVVASVIFGLIPLFSVPLIKAGMSVSSIVCYRFALSSVVMGSVLAVRRISFKINKKEAVTLLLLSVFYALTALLLTASYTYIPTGIATTIHFLYPVWVTLLTIFIFKGKVSKMTIVAMLFAIAGVALLSLSGTQGAEINGTGVLVVLGTVVAFGSYLAWLPHSAVKNMDGMKVTFWLMSICAVIFAVRILLKNGIYGYSPVPDGNCWANLLLLSILPTLVSNLTLIQAVKRVGSTITSVMGSLEPLTAVIIGVIVFKERCTPMQIAGIMVVVIAVTLLIFMGSKGKKA